MATATDRAKPLPMFNRHEYSGEIVFRQHREVINDQVVYRNEIVSADDRITIYGDLVRHIERVPYEPAVAVIRCEITGREYFYRQVGWNYLTYEYGAFERLRPDSSEEAA